MNEFFDKEEWANRKQQDRESAYAMVDDALKKVGTDGKAFQTYLDVQSKFERYSVSNALLVAAQKPDATDLGEANFWRGRGGYIRKGESGILLIGIYVSNERVYKRREEQGSARWGNPLSIAKRYQQSGNANKLLTQQMALGLDGRKHRRNLNVLICGGSGAGKTRYYAKPNIMQANTSFVILDPKGELLRDTGHLLEEKGYVIKVLDLINPERSHCYNPFVYLRDDDDIQRLATNIMKNTTPKDSKSSDHFWEDMAAMLLKALISYLHYEAPPEEQNFPMVMDMIRAGDVKEDNEEYVSTLDELFERLERRNPEHIAVRYYKGYHSGSGKTLKSIQITLISHLEKFNLTSLAGITQTDEMELGEIGERKTAVFAVIPDSDSSYNFIVGMLYTQLFQQLYRKADFEHGDPSQRSNGFLTLAGGIVITFAKEILDLIVG